MNPVGEVVSSIRTVASFNAEPKFFADYSAQVDKAARVGVLRAVKGGFMTGIASAATTRSTDDV